MSGRRHLAIGPALVFAVVLAGCAAPAPVVTGAVDRLDVRGVVGPDGSLDVFETLVASPDAEGRLQLTRHVHFEYGDEVSFQTASVDGRSVSPDGAEFALAPDGASDLDATWRLAQVTGTQSLGLSYSVASAVEVSPPRGRLTWTVLAPGHRVDGGEVSVVLELPDGVQFYEGTGMAEAGWTIELGPGRVTAHRRSVASGEAATLLAVFDVDTSQVVLGDWQWDRDRSGEYFLALISAGLFILVIGAGILAQVRVQYPPVGPDASEDVRRAAAADRAMLARGFRVSAAVGIVVAVVSAMAADRWLSGLGSALQAIPGSIAVVSLAFLVAGWWYGRGQVAAR